MRLTALVVSISAISIQPSLAASEHFVAGRLECDLSRSEGEIIGFKQDVDCVFHPSEPGTPVRYTGSIDNFGFDIGEIEKANLIWAVDAVSRQPSYDLEGIYRGVEASAAVGVGGGAVILTGGTHGTFSLQPVAVGGQEGLDISVGITQLRLKAAL
ncbi:hypothetical protein GGQ64_004770 [Rhizobium azooxidifex]|uniref:DUF992 domain-containing protein n=1 Tax=Mycoplana azooxidifex TaxID=1636188 RepID=A0A7W6DE19_9HYPH|nr:DUF992 domain-containing protein [Mycoplana azooxidifex]MBB3979526.1 hypothetical protein [Mycoplana azooxidifex]